MNSKVGVIKISEYEDGKRSKAMAVASQMPGVTSVTIVRERKHLVVVGRNVDWAKLANKLKRIFRHAEIVDVRDMTPTTTEFVTAYDHHSHSHSHSPRQAYHHQIQPYVEVPTAYGHPRLQAYHQYDQHYNIGTPVHDSDPHGCSIM